MSETTEGGCLCGAVRYRVTGEPVAATLCHCGDCRRASGGTNIAWAVFDLGDFEWLGDEPEDYSSSPGIRWLFCKGCGSTPNLDKAWLKNGVFIAAGMISVTLMPLWLWSSSMRSASV